MMSLFGPAARRVAMARGALTVLFLLATCVASFAASEFPYDQELMLDAARMGRVKRLPMLTVSPNGDATVQLWCKDVPARVQVTDSAIAIETAPLPDALPSMMSDGQCSPERMQADADMLAALTQVNAWRSKGDRLVLSGPTELRFFRSSH